ncbi:MAG: xylulokinase [Lachnospiraceae bacterium]|nr:xylulokinase [Lachnospiraceae bacterium]
MYTIGIDLGTSAVKLLLADESLNIVRTVSREYPLSFPQPGWSEQDPLDWFRQSMDGIRELTEGIDRSEVAAIAAAGQMHGLVILDGEDRVLRPAILWNDGRTQEEVRFLNETVGEDILVRETGNIAFAGFTAPKILWVRAHEPELFGRIAKIMLPKDYLNYRMTGSFVTDYSDASGMLLLDVAGKKWSPLMLQLCGISEGMLPALHESYDVIGRLNREAAALTGLPEGVPVLAGAGDNAAAAIGTGTVGEGKCNCSLGTSGTLFVSGDVFRQPANPAIHSFCHADGHFHLMACMLSSASSNRWFMEDILGSTDYAAAQAAIGELGENRVFFLPYLMGERCPHNDTAVRAMFYGMSMDTSRADMVQAVLEGVAFSFRDAYEIVKACGVRIERTKICGGGAKSALWKRIMANVLDLPVDVIASEQGPGLGAAILAMNAAKGLPPEALREDLTKITETVYPEEALVKRYNRQYEIYRRFYPALKDIV